MSGAPAERGPGQDAGLRAKLDAYLEREIDLGSFPGAVYAVGTSRGIAAENALGHSVVKPAKIAASTGTIYDAASLTKPLITTTLVLQLASEGQLDLKGRVSEHVEELRDTDKSEITFVDLLSHRAGYQAWYPLYTAGMGDAAYLKALVRRPLRYRPGTREIYSCLNFILLLLALERIAGRKAEDLARQRIFEPLGLVRSMFNPPAQRKFEIAATELGNWSERAMVGARGLSFNHFRNYMIWGEVNDGNAWYMGGMAGNAGLFSTAAEVFRIAQSYLAMDGLLLREEMIRLSTRNYTVGLEENRGLGWQLASSKENGPASMLSERSFGHTGFTGTSVWSDPERDLIMVLMTNRIHPTVQQIPMQKTRREFHRIVVDAW